MGAGSPGDERPAPSRRRSLDVERPRRPRRAVLLVSLLAGALLIGGVVFGVIVRPFSTGADPDATPAAPGAPVDPAGTAGTILAAQLQPGQCFASFESAWQPSFELADCAAPHAAQLTAVIAADQALGDDAYPGQDTLRAEAMRACQAPSAIATDVAASIDDLVLDASYPLTETEWNAGDRSYRCFASRSMGEPLTSSLAVG